MLTQSTIKFLAILSLLFFLGCQDANRKIEPSNGKMALLADLQAVKSTDYQRVSIKEFVTRNNSSHKRIILVSKLKEFQKTLFEHNSLKRTEQLSYFEFEQILLPQILPLFNITESEYSGVRNSLFQETDSLKNINFDSLSYSTYPITSQSLSPSEFDVSNIISNSSLNLVNSGVHPSIVLQTLDAYYTIIAQNEILAQAEKQNLLMGLDILISSIIYSEEPYIGERCTSNACEWGCAGDILVPAIGGGLAGGPVGAGVGLISGLWTAYRNGCMD